jgi:hypothetical protein
MQTYLASQPIKSRFKLSPEWKLEIRHLNVVLPSHLSFNIKVKLSRYRHAGDKAKRKYNSYSFLTSSLVAMNDLRHASEIMWIQKLEENRLPLPGIEPRLPGCPDCSQTLYWVTQPPLFHWSRVKSLYLGTCLISYSLFFQEVTAALRGAQVLYLLAVRIHAMEAPRGSGGIASTHSRPRH